MRLLQINSSSGYSSTGKIVSDIANLLEKQGNETLACWGRHYVDRGNPTYRIGSKLSIATHGIYSRMFDRAGFGSRVATQKLIDEIEKFNPDIIHLHNLHGYYINIELLFKYLKKINKPVVWTLHDCWAFTGHCTYFTKVKCESWKTKCSNCPLKSEYPGSLLLDNSARNYEQKRGLFTGPDNMVIVTPSEWLADFVRESYLSKYSVITIPNGIDLHVFKPTKSEVREKYGLGSKKIILGVANLWDERKGLSDFIKLADKIREEYSVVLVGLNDKQIEETKDHVIGIKRTDNVAELAALYSEAEVLVNPTYEDNYPTINLEAQACGTPVITYRTGGSPESVPDRDVVQVGDIDGIIDLIKHGSLECKQAEMFDKNKMLEGYMQIYTKLLSDKK